MSIEKILGYIAISGVMISCNGPNDVKSLNNELDSVSYAVGMSFGSQLKVNFDEVNYKILEQGIRDYLDSTNLLIEDKQMQNVIRAYFDKKQAEKIKKREEENEIKFADNRKAGEDFLEANKSKKGIVTTKSGLQYMILKKGKGTTPKPTDRIKIHYHGTTIDGKVFDSTVERKQPYISAANQFVPGFNEALSLMKVGAKYKVFIPQEIAYGPQRRGALIEPFSALIFEIELLEILK